MIVCVCNAVRERQIRELVAQSETQVRMRDLREQLGVCSDCGKCARRARGILRKYGGGAGAVSPDATAPGGIAGIPVTATTGVRAAP
ncbi:(2Fe-2S)-binding protein [Thioalkalivibrio sp. ALJ24]|uniref:(2Fe-2S)-binding protein n=1 Tax=Thioalkalivibrio sp. ALJ24 TaxID=545276 RepID=UPI00047717FB|nr:(2Fe-2S)-binding protein [Thioalkalivibrio sp. ALJ24]